VLVTSVVRKTGLLGEGDVAHRLLPVCSHIIG
jgi:hypothetical protein